MKYFTVKEFIDLVESKSAELSKIQIITHHAEPGRTYHRCTTTADTVSNLRVEGDKLKWSDGNGDPTIRFDNMDEQIVLLTNDGEWLTTVCQEE